MQAADVVVVKCNRTMSVDCRLSTVDSGNSITDTEILLKSMHKQPSNCGGNERHFQFNPIQVRGCL